MKNYLFTAIGMAILASCGPDLPSGSESAYLLDFDKSSGVRSSKSSEVKLTKALLNFKGFKLYSNLEDTARARAEASGPYFVDLLKERSTPEIPFTGTPSGTYLGIAMHLGQLPARDTGSIYVEGVKDGIPFVLDVRQPLRWDYSARSVGFKVGQNSITKFKVHLGLVESIEALNFFYAVKDINDVVIINEDVNVDLYQKVLKSLAERGERGDEHVHQKNRAVHGGRG